MTPFLGSQPWEAPDPLPVMRRELKLLLIEDESLTHRSGTVALNKRGSKGEGGIFLGNGKAAHRRPR